MTTSTLLILLLRGTLIHELTKLFWCAPGTSHPPHRRAQWTAWWCRQHAKRINPLWHERTAFKKNEEVNIWRTSEWIQRFTPYPFHVMTMVRNSLSFMCYSEPFFGLGLHWLVLAGTARWAVSWCCHRVDLPRDTHVGEEKDKLRGAADQLHFAINEGLNTWQGAWCPHLTVTAAFVRSDETLARSLCCTLESVCLNLVRLLVN